MKKISYEGDRFRDEVKNYLQSLKEGGKQIIDVGASMSDWTYPYIDAIVDINKFETDKLFFQGNITLTDVWDELEEYVSQNGKFDFSVCSHTLEDISNPLMVCKKLEKISKSGVILVPSKYIEFSRPEGSWRGYIHHRWIWSIENDELIGYPKVNFLDYDSSYEIIGQRLNDQNVQICLFWEENIPVKIVNDDFLGPSTLHVFEYYKKLLIDNN